MRILSRFDLPHELLNFVPASDSTPKKFKKFKKVQKIQKVEKPLVVSNPNAPDIWSWMIIIIIALIAAVVFMYISGMRFIMIAPGMNTSVNHSAPLSIPALYPSSNR